MSVRALFPEGEPTTALVVVDDPTREIEAVPTQPIGPGPAQPVGPGSAPPAKKAKGWSWRFRSPKTSLSTPSIVAITGLLLMSALALWLLVYALVVSAVQEHRSQHVLGAQLNEELALQTSPIGGRIKPGAPVARMQVRRLGSQTLVIVEGTTSSILDTGPGHRRDSPLPGEAGVSFIMGRSVTFGAPFGRIDTLQPGDPITVESGEGLFTFIVDGLRRNGDPQHLLPAGAARITLVTSGTAPGRHAREALFVDATSRQPAQPPTDGRPTRLTAAETYLRGDVGALNFLVPWLALLAAAILALAWAQLHWGLEPTVLVGVPVLAALTWGATEAVSRLVPNLL